MCIIDKGSQNGYVEMSEAINIKLTHKVTNLEKETALSRFLEDYWLEMLDG